MKLKDLAKKPQLIEIVLDNKDLVKEYGDTITFHTWDRVDVATFMRLGSIDTKNTAELIMVVKDLVLDENGNPILTDETTLPTKVMLEVLTNVMSILGK